MPSKKSPAARLLASLLLLVLGLLAMPAKASPGPEPLSMEPALDLSQPETAAVNKADPSNLARITGWLLLAGSLLGGAGVSAYTYQQDKQRVQSMLRNQHQSRMHSRASFPLMSKSESAVYDSESADEECLSAAR